MDTPRVSKALKMEAGLRIRIDPELRDDFIKACRQRDVTAAQVLRSFMRDFVAKARLEAPQGDLFSKPTARIRHARRSSTSRSTRK